jgi:hypothetical protein
MADDEVPVEWRQITCAERDALYQVGNASWRVLARRTDLGGIFGRPTIYTEWGTREEGPRLRDWRWPSSDGGPDAEPCKHYVPVERTG